MSGMLPVLFIAVGLAMDALAVAVGLSLRIRWRSPRQFFRLSFHFGLFQFLMPLIGWFAGAKLQRWIEPVDHWVAFGLLGMIGLKMIRESFGSHEEPTGMGDPTRGHWLILLAVATSIDALAVGVSLPLITSNIWFAALVIGLVAAGLTLAGMYFGNRIGAGRARWLEVAGGVILIGIGLRILIQHIGLTLPG